MSIEAHDMEDMKDDSAKASLLDSAKVVAYSTENESQEGEQDANFVVEEGGYGTGLAFRCIILFCVSFLSFGSYFAYDSVSATGTYIMTDLYISESEFGLLYSVYSFPNIFLVLVGGYLIDKIGNRWSAVLFCSFICVGSFVVALAPSLGSFPLMIFGRFIFGIGAESSYVVQNSICVEWFQGKYLATAMGITVSVARMGSILAFNSEAAIAEAEGSYTYALWTAFLACFFSLVVTVLYVFLDKMVKRKVDPQVLKRQLHPSIQWKDLKKLGLNFWLLAAIATTIYSSIFTFLAIASSFIVDKYSISSEDTGFYISLIDIASLVLTPLFGWTVDKTGKRGILLLVGNSIAVFAYLLLGLTNLTPVIGIMMLGFHFALMPAALWPCVPLVVPSVVEGTAFAILSSLQSASLTGYVPLSGLVGEKFGFATLCIMWAGLAFVSVMLSLLWNILDSRKANPMLNMKLNPHYSQITEPTPPQ